MRIALISLRSFWGIHSEEIRGASGLLEPISIETSLGLVDSAKFLPATKSTGHFVCNPRRLSSGKPFLRPNRAESLIVLYSRDVEYRVFKLLRQFHIE